MDRVAAQLIGAAIAHGDDSAGVISAVERELAAPRAICDLTSGTLLRLETNR